MPTTIATLNIRHGGSRTSAALATRLRSYDADILVVSEFRTNAAGAQLIARLKDVGYDVSHPGVGPKDNAVLIAARGGIDRSWAFSESLDPRHLWCAEIDGICVCGVYMPQKMAKLPYWETLVCGARDAGIDLLIGDFNTGNNDLDKDPRGAKFIGPEMPGRLVAQGYTDMWRSLHPGVREYSWFSRPGDNGFRLDYIFAVADLAEKIQYCEFDHAPRNLGETDHSGLVAVMDD
ncbi:endonuclease/exonuclease/phosphatase family protein [Mycolicibacterium iranicum]|uniref:endonuclease/exonuclease/phosphatase family protein n=1 Tax=Mycolicibacterium iranicum TaxID=912594 RepID=UPI0004670B9C|nr:endonuclease/exonuclease/phosphatase family protein [Mycolicibacterium iranicum]